MISTTVYTNNLLRSTARMRRVGLFGTAFIVALFVQPAEAQICRGTADISSAQPFQVGGSISFADTEGLGRLTALNGSFAGGNDSAFGVFNIGHVAYDEADLSAITVDTTLGGQIAADRARRVVVCPSFTFGSFFGRPDEFDTTVRAWSVGGGGSVGVALGNDRVQVVPGVGLFVSRQRTTVDFGEEDETSNATIGTFIIGAGLIMNERYSLTPLFSIPFGEEGLAKSFTLRFMIAFPKR